MKKINLNDVRSALVDLEFLSQEESDELSDAELLKQDFREDLALDSLDFILLLEQLERCSGRRLSLIDLDFSDFQSVQDLVCNSIHS